MTWIAAWDIRQESYANGANVTSLQDLIGSVDLGAIGGGAVLPTYEAASDSMVFAASASAIGTATIGTALEDLVQGAQWSMFCLVNQASFDAGMFCGFGINTNDQQGVLIRDVATGAVTCLVRDAASTSNVATTSGTRAVDTWYVVGLVLTAANNLVVTIDGGVAGTIARTANLAGNSWTQFAIGCFFRNSVGIHANGRYRAVWLSDADETANYATIVAAMKAGDLPGGASITSIGFDNEVLEDEDAFSYVGTELEDTDHLRISSTNTTVTQEWATASETATGGMVDSALRGQLPFTDINHVLTVTAEDSGDVGIASRTFTFVPFNAEDVLVNMVVLPVAEAYADRTSGSALQSLPTIPALSQCIMPPWVLVEGVEHTIVYEMVSGHWTGRISVPTAVITVSTNRDGEYRPAPNGPWEALPVTLNPEGGGGGTGGDATLNDCLRALPVGGGGSPA